MAGFRGIGDTATEVSMKQDQMAQQSAMEANRLNQQAQQFEDSQENRREESKLERDLKKSQFNEEMAVNKDNTAWNRSQAEAKVKEDARRFGIEQGTAGRREKREERQLGIEEFRKGLDERRTEAELGQRDVQTEIAHAQLGEIRAAAAEEKKARDNRDRFAKGAFGSMLIAGFENGGVVPLKAIDAANKQLAKDDPENRITKGWFDENGVGIFEMTNAKTGQTKQLRMLPENQYAAIREGIDKPTADMWHDTYKVGSAARAAIARRRLEYDEKEQLEINKEQRKKEAETNDPQKQADKLLAMAKTYSDMAGDLKNMSISDEDRKRYAENAAVYAKEADALTRGIAPQKPQPKPFVLTPEMQSKEKIDPNNRVIQNADGGYTVMWYDKNKDLNKKVYPPGSW